MAFHYVDAISQLSVEKSIVKDISWNSLRKDENFGFVLQKVKKGAILSKARNKKYRILRNGEVLAVSNEEDEVCLLSFV